MRAVCWHILFDRANKFYTKHHWKELGEPTEETMLIEKYKDEEGNAGTYQEMIFNLLDARAHLFFVHSLLSLKYIQYRQRP